MQSGLGLCFAPTQFLMGGGLRKMGRPLPRAPSSTSVPWRPKKTFFHSRDQIRSQEACSFLPQWLLSGCVAPLSLARPSGQSWGEQSLSRYGPPAHTLSKGLPPLSFPFPPFPFLYPAPLHPPWRALHALAGLLRGTKQKPRILSLGWGWGTVEIWPLAASTV